jgi:hypothetical protein
MSRPALQRGGGAPDGVVSVAVGICPLAAINLPVAATTQGGSERRSRSAASVTDPALYAGSEILKPFGAYNA